MTGGSAVKDLYRAAIPSVVSIYVPTGGDPRQPSGGAGSGFVYDDAGRVVTNQHVVGETDYVEIRYSDGAWRTGEVIGTDAYTDLAVIAVTDPPAAARPLRVAAANPEPGERVAAIGNPMGLDGTITVGHVSGTNRSSPVGAGFAIPETIQTDAAVNPGNSGGPLLTLDGTVVGVNRAKAGDNIGFAISPVIVNRVVPALIRDGVSRHASLDVRTLDVSPTVAAANGLDEATGVLVVGVRHDGAALRGCDRVVRMRGRAVPTGGDVIVGIDGEAVRSTEELTSYLLTRASPGEIVELTIRRGSEEVTRPVRLGERPLAGSHRGVRPGWPSREGTEDRSDDRRGWRIPVQ